MSIWKKLRAFAGFLGIEVQLVGEQNLLKSTGPASTTPLTPSPGAGATSSPTPLPGTNLQQFVPLTILRQLPTMNARDVDGLDFGCVKVSDKGVVLMYNRWEAEFAGVDQQSALGRNFFRELAPCTNNRLIFGRFKEGIEAGELNTIVSYAFTYKMRPTLVRVHLYRDPVTSTNWVLVQKHENVPGK